VCRSSPGGGAGNAGPADDGSEFAADVGGVQFGAVAGGEHQLVLPVGPVPGVPECWQFTGRGRPAPCAPARDSLVLASSFLTFQGVVYPDPRTVEAQKDEAGCYCAAFADYRTLLTRNETLTIG
jgi:hypothetical protein